MSERRRFAFALLGAVLLAFVPYREFFGSRVPVGRDLPFYFYPHKAHLAEALRAGEAPWIDRFKWGGAPLLSAPGPAAFDPVNVLFLLLPLGAAMKAWILLRLALSVCGFALFARLWGISPGVSAVSGLLFGLGGVSVSLAPFPEKSAALALLPWLAAFALDLTRRLAAGTVARLSVVVALLLVSSAPEFVFFGAVIVLFVLAGPAPGGRPGTGRPAPLGRVVGAGAIAVTLGAGLGAPALLPAAVAARESSRGPGGGTNVAWASQRPLALSRLPELLGDGLVFDWTKGKPTPDPDEYPYLPSVTPGRVALLLALAGVALGGAGRMRATLLAILGVLLALGSATPLFPALLRVVPPLTAIRFPEKYVVLAGFGLAWLAALGLGALGRRAAPGIVRFGLPLVALLTLADRERVARRLSPTEPGEVLTEAPQLLSKLPRGGEGPPPRLFAWDSYTSVPAFDYTDLASANRTAREMLMPSFATLFGAAYLFEPDYDLSLPRQAFEWTSLLNEAVPSKSPLPLRFARGAGAAAVVRLEPRPGGRFTPELHVFRDALPPYRFAGRVVGDADGRRLFARMLEEGFEADTAYVRTSPSRLPDRLARGRVLSVRDRPSALTLEVEVEGGEGFLALYRLKEATQEAELDGREVGVEEVAFSFAGIRVPPGRHLLVLRPETRWVKIGMGVSVVSIVAVIFVFAASRRRSALSPRRWA